MEERNYTEKERKIAAKMLKLYATYCAQFWVDVLTNPSSFWSCKVESRSKLQLGYDFAKAQIPSIPITFEQIKKFIKNYEKFAANEIESIVKSDKSVAIILGDSDGTLSPGFTSGITEGPEFFLRQRMKEANITGLFFDMQKTRIIIKEGSLYLEHAGKRHELI